MDAITSKIFILDDEEIFSFSMEHYLKKAGFSNIRRFQTSEALLTKMHEQPDVLILDHFLNNEIGLDILKQIKQTHPKTKVIYLSAQKTAAIAVRALKLGAFAYLEKSVTDMKEIIKMIESDENPEF